MTAMLLLVSVYPREMVWLQKGFSVVYYHSYHPLPTQDCNWIVYQQTILNNSIICNDTNYTYQQQSRIEIIIGWYEDMVGWHQRNVSLINSSHLCDHLGVFEVNNCLITWIKTIEQQQLNKLVYVVYFANQVLINENSMESSLPLFTTFTIFGGIFIGLVILFIVNGIYSYYCPKRISLVDLLELNSVPLVIATPIFDEA